MKAFILAAGEGTRLRPLTLDRPKCLVELKGKPLLQYQIDALRATGIHDSVSRSTRQITRPSARARARRGRVQRGRRRGGNPRRGAARHRRHRAAHP